MIKTCAHLLLAVLSGSVAAYAQPINDNFANRISLTGTNILITSSNSGATREAGEPYHADWSGGKSVWWTWTATQGGTVMIDTYGSSFDTLLGVYIGNSVSTLTEIASNDDGDYGVTSTVVFDTVKGQTYQIAVDGFGGESGTIWLEIYCYPTPAPKPAPAWSLPDPYGATVNSTDFAGKVVLLNFWGVWCPYCVQEMPDLIDLQATYGSEGLVIIGADYGDSVGTVQSFLASFSPAVNYPVVMTSGGTQQAYGGISGYPTSFLIDRDNLIRKTWVGMQSRSSFERQIVPLLYNNTRLGCDRVGSQMTFHWPITKVPFTLQTCTNPATADWTTCVLPTPMNGLNTVQMEASDQIRFFRLHLEY